MDERELAPAIRPHGRAEVATDRLAARVEHDEVAVNADRRGLDGQGEPAPRGERLVGAVHQHVRPGLDLRDPGHRSDGPAKFFSVPHEHRQDQLRRREVCLTDEVSKRGGPTQSARTILREAGHSLLWLRSGKFG